LFCDSSSSLPDRNHFPPLFDLLALVFLLSLQCPPLVVLINNVVTVKIARVLCPEISMQSCSSLPALRRLRTALRRMSWGTIPFKPTLSQAVLNAFANDLIGFPPR
jgi:hypothetical protein